MRLSPKSFERPLCERFAPPARPRRRVLLSGSADGQGKVVVYAPKSLVVSTLTDGREAEALAEHLTKNELACDSKDLTPTTYQAFRFSGNGDSPGTKRKREEDSKLDDLNKRLKKIELDLEETKAENYYFNVNLQKGLGLNRTKALRDAVRSKVRTTVGPAAASKKKGKKGQKRYANSIKHDVQHFQQYIGRLSRNQTEAYQGMSSPETRSFLEMGYDSKAMEKAGGAAHTIAETISGSEGLFLYNALMDESFSFHQQEGGLQCLRMYYTIGEDKDLGEFLEKMAAKEARDSLQKHRREKTDQR